MTTPQKPTGPFQIVLNLLAGLVFPIIYGTTVTVVLAFYYAAIKAEDITVFPRMLRFVSMQFTPFFTVGYHIARQILPDRSVQRTTNFLLPIVEAFAAVILLGAILSLPVEFADHYLNFALTIVKMLVALLLARLWVRRTFRH